MAQQGLGLLLLATLLVAVHTDLRARRIPNWLTLPALGLALAIRLAAGGWEGALGLQAGLLGAATAFAPFFLLALAGGMGMGDVKLAAAVGACVGMERIFEVLLCIALAGGVQGAIAIVRSGALAGSLRRVAALACRRQARAAAEPPPRRVTVPYGLAIAAGTAWALLAPPLAF